ncbi:MAG: Mobile element protein, partial [uncultured Phycisphaerae bacterium]
GTDALPDGPDGRAVAGHRADDPAGAARRAAPHRGHARGAQRHQLPRPHRLPVARDPARPAEERDRAALLRPVPRRRHLGTRARRVARADAPRRGPRRAAVGGRDRQPDGQDRRKRGARGYDAGKKL